MRVKGNNVKKGKGITVNNARQMYAIEILCALVHLPRGALFGSNVEIVKPMVTTVR